MFKVKHASISYQVVKLDVLQTSSLFHLARQDHFADILYLRLSFHLDCEAGLACLDLLTCEIVYFVRATEVRESCGVLVEGVDPTVKTNSIAIIASM